LNKTWAALFDSLGHYLKTKCSPWDAQKRESVDMVEILQGMASVGGKRASMQVLASLSTTTFSKPR